jgi:Lysyl oxidase/WD40-like Beta Propeller Repeat
VRLPLALLLAAIAAFAPAAGAARPRAEPAGVRLLVERNGGLVVADPAKGTSSRLALAGDAVWSRDGTLLAFARAGELWLANADGSGVRRLTRTPNVAESEPSWGDAHTLAYTASIGPRQIRVLRLPSATTRRIAAGGGEDWSATFSADGKRLAFVSTRLGAPAVFVARADGTEAEPFHPTVQEGETPPADIQHLAWSADGRKLAYAGQLADGTHILVDDGVTRVTVELGDFPVWSPPGARLAFSDAAGNVAIVDAGGSRRIGAGVGAPLDWRRVPLGDPQFPDLRQRPPSGLTVTQAHGRWLLGFTSLVDNAGPGVLWLRSMHKPRARTMQVTQLVGLAGGGVRPVSGAGALRYTVAPPHYHWHLLGFEHYELRRAADFKLVVRDRKSGFCLADHYGIARGIPHGPPRFLGSCAQFDPRARSVDQGTSVGYTDRYPGFFHGQQLDITHVAPGRYWLVHRVNEDFGLRETSYGNDAASLLVRISRPEGRRGAPRVSTLRACGKERC